MFRKLPPRFSPSLSMFVAGMFGLLVCFSPLWMSNNSHGQNNSVATVSAASFLPPLAPESMAAAYGQKLATQTMVADTVPLPTTLGGTTVRINGLAAPLFFVSPFQINYLIPAGTATGNAIVSVTSGDGTVSTGIAQVRAVAPAIFTANAGGSGAPAAGIFRIAANGAQSYEPIVEFNAATSSFRLRPIDLGPEGDRVFLILYLSGIRNAKQEHVRVLLGGQSLPVLYVGASPEFTGLDQINMELPRSLIGSGVISLSVSVAGFSPSNEVLLEIAGTQGISPPQVAGFGPTTVLAGGELVITGSGFSSTPAENKVRITDVQGQSEAQVIEASATRLKVLVPFGAGTGKVSVRTPQGENESPTTLTLRTSVSGFVQDTRRQPIRGVTVQMSGTNLSVQTNAEGAFILPDTPPSTSATIEIDGTTVPGGLPYPKQQFKMRVIANRDNQVGEYIELKQATGPSQPFGTGFNAGGQLIAPAEWPVNATVPEVQIQTGQVILDVPNNATVRFPGGGTSGSLTLTVLESGRTPSTLPVGQFSPVIAQITPFGATITPGAKLTFPNPDGYAPNSALKLYRYDQKPNSLTLGEFVESGTATVSADGQRIESAPNAVIETTYYFASGVRPTVTLIGRVVENNLNRTPVRRSLVNARGQGIFTDGNGGFVVRNVPVNASSAFAAQLSGEIVIETGVGEVLIADDRIGIEADFMRPSTRVDRSQQEQVQPLATGPTVSPDLILSSTNANRAPTIFAPADISMNAGTTLDVPFFAGDPDTGQAVEITVSGASFATIIRGNGDNFTLRLIPGINDGGNYTLTLNASDGQGGSTSQRILLRVNGLGVIANAQVITVNPNTPTAIRLTGSDPVNRPLTFFIVNPPTRGALSGTAPDVIYTPAKDYTGTDSFTFKVRAGQAESNEATVTIRVQGGANSAPVLTAPVNLSVNAGETLRFAVTASDPDAGQTLRFEVLGKPEGATIIETPARLEFSWTPAFLQSKAYKVLFRVTDNGTPALSATQEVAINADAKWARTSGPAGGGLITTLAVSGSTVFAGSLGGGVYNLTDQGRQWTNISAGLADGDIYSLLANGEFLFAGTERGVFRLAISGGPWVNVSSGLPPKPYVLSLGRSNATLFAGTGDGLFRSINQGESWTRVNFPVVSVSSFTTLGTTLFVGTGDEVISGVSSDGRGVFRSTDGGQNWTPVNNGLPTFISGGQTVYQKVFSLSANENRLYAGTNRSGVFVSSDQGQTWAPANTGLPTYTSGGQSVYDSIRAFAVKGTNLIAGADRGIFVLPAPGQTWVNYSTGLPRLNQNAYALAFNGDNLFAGSFSGVAVTPYTPIPGGTGGGSGSGWTPANLGLGNLTINKLVQKDNFLLAATEGGIFRSTDNGASWSAVNTGLTNLNVNTVYTGVSFYTRSSAIFAGTRTGGAFRSDDNGLTWIPINNGISNPDVRAFSAIRQSVFDPNSPINVYTGTYGNGVFLTATNGIGWSPTGAGLVNRNILSLADGSRYIYAGTDGSGVYFYDPTPRRWSPFNSGLTNLKIFTLAQPGGVEFLAGTDGGGVYFLPYNEQRWLAAKIAATTTPVMALEKSGNRTFAATNGSGVFVTSDSFAANVTVRWTPFNEGLSNLSTSSLAVSGNYLLTGTRGGGIFRLNLKTSNLVEPSLLDTAQQGPNWRIVNQGFTNTFVRSLVRIGSTIFAGTYSDGIYKSSDEGQSWSPTGTNGIPVIGDIEISVLALAASGNTLYAAIAGRSGIYRSTDLGENWTRTTANFAQSLLTVGSNVFAGDIGFIARLLNGGSNWEFVSTGLSSNVQYQSLANIGAILFAGGVALRNESEGGVYRSTNNGQSWTLIRPGTPSGYVWALATSGTTLYAGTLDKGVFRSTDNAQTWLPINNGLPSQTQISALAANRDTLVAATTDGIFLSINQGQNWTEINNSLTLRYAASLLANDTAIFTGTQGGGVFKLSNNVQSWAESDVGLASRFINDVIVSGSNQFAATLGYGVARSSNQGQSWTPVNNGLPPDANIYSLATNGPTLWAGSFGDGVFRSINQGTSWTPVNSGLDNKFVNRLFVNGGTLYAGTEGGVYRSLDGGNNWTLIMTGMGTLPVDAFVAFSGTVYAGTDGNGVFRLNSDGISWTRKNSGLTSQQVRSLSANGNVLYAGTIGGGICISRNGGDSWTSANNQLPSTLNVFAFAVSGQKVYAGSIYGVFVTENEGRNWTQINAGLLNTYVTGLAVSGEQLFASTASGGVFVSRIP